MGGTQVMLDSSKTIDRISRDLDIVKYSVYLKGGNFSLFDTNSLQDQIARDTGRYLDNNAIKNERMVADGLGGGREVETLKEIIYSLWENKGVIQFIFSLLKSIRSLGMALIISRSQDTKPRISIGLRIETNSYIDKAFTIDIEEVIAERFSNLLLVGEAVANNIHANRPYLLIDFFQEIYISKSRTSLAVNIPYEHKSKRLTERLIFALKRYKYNEKCYSEYKLTRIGLIARLDSKVNGGVEYFQLEKPRTHYLLA